MPANVSVPLPEPPRLTLLPNTKALEITKLPIPSCSITGATPASEMLLPVMYCVTATALVRVICLETKPVRSLLAV